jgi:hypothetical protein
MEIKKQPQSRLAQGPLVLLAVMFLMASPPFLNAQNSGYSSEYRFAQRLTWTGDENTRRYEVVIEKEENRSYRQIRKESTDASFIVVILEPGMYRYRVTPYDFLDRPGGNSNWINFQIRAVLDPELDSFSPNIFYMNADTLHELSVSAKNLTPDTVIFLRRFGGASSFPADIKIYEDNNNARVFFDNNRLVIGYYGLIVRKPGWLEASREGFTISAPIKPELDDFSPSVFNIEKDVNAVHELTVTTRQLIPGAVIFLRHRNGTSIVPAKTNIHESGNYAQLSFNSSQLISGDYEVVVRNPGKLEASKKGLTVIDIERAKERARVDKQTKFTSVGVSVGTSFTVPVLAITVHGTIAPLRYSFLEIGMDFGMISGVKDAGYFSVYPFAHYAFFLPFPESGGWYIGAGGGWYWATHYFPQGKIPFNSPALDLITGFNIRNMFDVSYTIRANRLLNADGLFTFNNFNSKLSVGYVYRFKSRNTDAN